MNLRRLLNWLIPGLPIFGQPDPDLTYGDSVRALLEKSYPPHQVDSGDVGGGRFEDVYPNLPRGALTRIAEEVGCSRGYAAAVARRLGYQQEHRVG